MIGSSFAMCTLTSYELFRLTFATINQGALRIVEAYRCYQNQQGNVLSFVLLSWTLFTLMLTFLRSSLP